jgi:hypothetical protein
VAPQPSDNWFTSTFLKRRPPDYARPFERQHWGVVEALLRDPDGCVVSLQAPMADG